MGEMPKTQKVIIAFIFDPDDWNMKGFQVWIGAISYLALVMLVRRWEKRRGRLLADAGSISSVAAGTSVVTRAAGQRFGPQQRAR
jgi:hypothetical protein